VVSFTPRPLYRDEIATSNIWIGDCMDVTVRLNAVENRRHSNPDSQSILIMLLYVLYENMKMIRRNMLLPFQGRRMMKAADSR
jgi:hypothetical protein